MDKFPLYDTLNTNLPMKDLTLKQKKDFISKIENIDKQGSELVYILIRAYHIIEAGEKPTHIVPFEGKFLGENQIEFNMSKMPMKLRQLLYKFLCIHFKAMDEKKSDADNLKLKLI